MLLILLFNYFCHKTSRYQVLRSVLQMKKKNLKGNGLARFHKAIKWWVVSRTFHPKAHTLIPNCCDEWMKNKAEGVWVGIIRWVWDTGWGYWGREVQAESSFQTWSRGNEDRKTKFEGDLQIGDWVIWSIWLRCIWDIWVEWIHWQLEERTRDQEISLDREINLQICLKSKV